MMMRGKELLASDQLTQLAGRESRTLDGARRTSEALSWLDRRLDADLRASRADAPGAVPEEGETPDASRAETEAAMRSIVPSRSKAELLREKIERRGAMDAGVEVKSSEYARSGQSYLSENARARLDRIKEGHQVWQDQTPAGSGVAREDSRQPELWADQAHRQRSSLVHVRPFPDLSATSKAARESAAPHIASIYDQIFVDQIEDTCGQPDTEPVVDRFQDCTLVLDEAWDAVEGANDNVGGDMVGRRSHYERRLTQSIAESLGVPLHRVKVNEMHPGPSWYRVNELIVDLTMLPDAAGHPPTCKSLCEDLRAQAKAPGSQLRSRIPAVRVELPSEDLPYRAPDQTSRLTFSLLRGGIVEERPQEHKSAAHAARGGDSALLARDHVTSAPQHVQYMVQQVMWCSGVAVCPLPPPCGVACRCSAARLPGCAHACVSHL